jgi:phosphohistidine swiveling domain-containing protein
MNTIAKNYRDMSTERCGNKAANLALLKCREFNVPEFFVITGNAAADGARNIEGLLNAALDTLGSDTYAVRSSSREEDGASQSFAGQFDTFLGVSRVDVADKAKRVADSGDSAHLRTYREQAGVAAEETAPAVIIQAMIDADAAGVAFGADPVSGNLETAVIAATRGTGEALVSGEVQGDTWHVGPGDTIDYADIGGEHAVLDDEQVKAVASLVRAVSESFGCPQDIEWAWRGDRLYLLQSRPITTLPTDNAPEAMALWDNSNIVESYGGITLPLTFSVAREAYEEAYRHMGRTLGVSESTIRDNRRAYEQMIGLIRGRVYYNLLNWYRLLMLTPGFRYNATFMEQMMGVTDELPEDAMPTPPDSGPLASAKALWDYVRVGTRLLVTLAGHRRNVRRFHQRLEDILTPVDYGSMSLDALGNYYENLQAKVIPAWDTPLVNDLFCMIFHGALRAASEHWLGDDLADRHNELVAGEAAMISLEPVHRMQAMADIIRGDRDMVDCLCRQTPSAVQAAMAERPELERHIGAYIDRFGDRCLDELKLESATLQDDPLPLYRAVGHLAAAPAATHTGSARRQDTEAEVMARLSGRPVRRRLYRALLDLARGRIRDRENLRFERTRVYGRVRSVFLEIGQRLAAAGALNDPEDVFYLEAREVLEFIRGTGTGTPLTALVRMRREAYRRYESGGDLPRRFVTAGPPHAEGAIRASGERPREAGDARSGQACCQGIVRGQVKIVRNPRACEFREGDILVAERTDPGWVTIFPLVRGMIMERGSLLSHSAIVARELNIPAVVGVDGACDWLEDGDWVELDGGSGSIRKLGETEQAA